MQKIVILSLLLLFSLSPAHSYDDAHSQIDKHVTYLKNLYDQHYRSEEIPLRDDYATDHQYAYFKHPRITTCIHTIVRDKNLHSFFMLWDALKKEQSHDEKLLEEFCLLTIVFFNNIVNTLSQHSNYKDEQGDDEAHDVTVEEIIALYNRLAAMTLKNLIDLLSDIADTVAQRLAVSPQYHQKIFAWLRVPWWQPVIFVGAFIYHWFHTRDMERDMRGDSSSAWSMVYSVCTS